VGWAMKVTFDIEAHMLVDEILDAATCINLKRIRDGLKDDLKKSTLVFDNNKDRDKKIIKEHIKSCYLILKYFGK
jgi:hypothetical protein